MMSIALYEIFLDIDRVIATSRFCLDFTVASYSISHREILNS